MRDGTDHSKMDRFGRDTLHTRSPGPLEDKQTHTNHPLH